MRYLLLGFSLILYPTLMAATNAFPSTPPGFAEIKTLPAGILIKASGPGSYFDESSRLFGPLFRYISSRDIAMTTPVEATIKNAEMYFWIAPSEAAKVTGDAAGVEVIRKAERRVASLGARGGYTQANFEKTRAELLVWLQQQPAVEADGEVYAVYWNSPFTPWFVKRYEVHVPVRAR
ncbi:MAG: heme-binding protein [Opitutaceae bacterium]|nr:heme-binding protein [Opitutaceae bacterium]MBP9912196.1 heme-binding protein [Opitutaceae bacterium]